MQIVQNKVKTTVWWKFNPSGLTSFVLFLLLTFPLLVPGHWWRIDARLAFLLRLFDVFRKVELIRLTRSRTLRPFDDILGPPVSLLTVTTPLVFRQPPLRVGSDAGVIIFRQFTLPFLVFPLLLYVCIRISSSVKIYICKWLAYKVQNMSLLW